MELAARIRKALEPIEEVRVAYLFGSRVHGRTHAGSDVDIALSIRRGADTHAVEMRVLSALATELGALGERADLVNLDACGSSIAFRALRDGVRVLSRSEPERIAVETWIMRRYDDEAPHRQLFREAADRLGDT